LTLPKDQEPERFTQMSIVSTKGIGLTRDKSKPYDHGYGKGEMYV
jgi:hypothetical protein